MSQYELNPKVVYKQNLWVEIGNYQNQNPSDLIILWKSLNKQIAETFKAMPPDAESRMCDTGHDKTELHTLRWLAEDYVKHLKHHLHHILELEAIPY